MLRLCFSFVVFGWLTACSSSLHDKTTPAPIVDRNPMVNQPQPAQPVMTPAIEQNLNAPVSETTTYAYEAKAPDGADNLTHSSGAGEGQSAATLTGTSEQDENMRDTASSSTTVLNSAPSSLSVATTGTGITLDNTSSSATTPTEAPPGGTTASDPIQSASVTSSPTTLVAPPVAEYRNPTARQLSMPTNLSPAVASLAQQAEQQRQQGDYMGAAASLERALRLQSQNAYLWNRLAYTRLEQGLATQAMNLAAKSNRLAGEQPQLKQNNWLLIATAKRQSGDLAGALTAERQAQEIQTLSTGAP
jgi:hypothetical protein